MCMRHAQKCITGTQTFPISKLGGWKHMTASHKLFKTLWIGNIYCCYGLDVIRSPLRDAIGSFYFKKRTHPPLEQYITWTRKTQCITVQTHMPHCSQDYHHTISQWHRTVHIPRLIPRANISWILISQATEKLAFFPVWKKVPEVFRRNNNEPKTAPCDTLDTRLTSLPRQPLSITCCDYFYINSPV